jgi:hypothetical protein
VQDPQSLEPSICSIGRVGAPIAAQEEMRVRKHGRTTGFTEGVISDVSYDPLVGMSHLDPTVVALFEDQIRIEVAQPHLAFALGGDSGSLVVSGPNRRAVGLFFACPPSGSYGVANPIERVLSALDIALV